MRKLRPSETGVLLFDRPGSSLRPSDSSFRAIVAYVYDAAGNVRDITDGAGTAGRHYEYDALGRLVQVSGTGYGRPRLTNDEQWARHIFTPGVDIFRDWTLYLVEDDISGRLVWRCNAERDVHEMVLGSGEADRIVRDAVHELDRLLSMETRRDR